LNGTNFIFDGVALQSAYEMKIIVVYLKSFSEKIK